MIYAINLFGLPFLIVIWLIELYLFLASVRLVMSKIPTARQSNFYQQAKLLTDFIPDAVRQKLGKFKGKPMPSWLSWFIVIVSGFIIRQVLTVVLTM